ncbi:MAG: cupredoxin domain-containing protein [Candidatus Saccharibacteria bacterium]
MDNQEQQINIEPPKTKKKHILLITYIIVVVLLIITVAIMHNHKTTPKMSNNNTVSAISAASVSITPSGFVPQAVTVRVGQAVTWTNNDKSAHQIASDPYPKDNTLLSLNSKTSILSGHTYSYVFNKPGTYYYHDDLNPYTLKGTVIVQ